MLLQPVEGRNSEQIYIACTENNIEEKNRPLEQGWR